MSNAGVALFNIAKESVVRVNIKIGDHVSPIGTAFLYKQIIDDIGKKSRLYFFTNLHVIKALIDQLLYYSSQLILEGNLNELPVAYVSWTKKSAMDLKYLIVDKVYIPSKKALWNIISKPYYSHIDFSVMVFEVQNFTKKIPIFKISDNLEVQEGENIFAFGYPVGMDLTVSSGVVSHVYNCVSTEENKQLFAGSAIQHDILINHGNSGGPTVNEDGMVVGISTMGFEPQKAVGISFSLNMACITQLLETCNNLIKLSLHKLIAYHIEKTLSEALSN